MNTGSFDPGPLSALCGMLLFLDSLHFLILQSPIVNLLLFAQSVPVSAIRNILTQGSHQSAQFIEMDLS